jgi:2-polyprenyl-3-methyl-5-hydroxy-6-metoxy-1,4-benzoquinol methylase
MSSSKFIMQDSQYQFPYHYLAYLDRETPQIKRSLNWGFEYLTYMTVVADEISKLPHMTHLDVGCGDGYLLNMFHSESEKLGIDLSERAIAFAKAFSHDAKFEVVDLFTIDEKYDLVTLIEVLEHIPDDLVDRFIRQVIQLVKRDKYFIISVPTTVLPLNKKHYRHYDETLLSEHVDNNVSVELIKELRVYKTTRVSRLMIRLLNNKFWTINHTQVLNKFWRWHLENNCFADRETGHHIIRIYQKK